MMLALVVVSRPKVPAILGTSPRREHESQPQQGVVLEHHEPCHQDGGLEECCQAQADDLLHPLHETVHISTGDAEHIQRSHSNLDEQDAAPLQISKKDLDYRVGHKDDTKEQHDGAGNDAKAKIHCHLCHVRDAFHTAEIRDDLLSHIPNAGPVAGEPGAELALQRYGQGIEPHGKNGEQADGEEALDGVESGLLEIAPAGGVLDAALKGAHHQAHTIQRPAELRKKNRTMACTHSNSNISTPMLPMAEKKFPRKPTICP